MLLLLQRLQSLAWGKSGLGLERDWHWCKLVGRPHLLVLCWYTGADIYFYWHLSLCQVIKESHLIVDIFLALPRSSAFWPGGGAKEGGGYFGHWEGHERSSAGTLSWWKCVTTEPNLILPYPARNGSVQTQVVHCPRVTSTRAHLGRLPHKVMADLLQQKIQDVEYSIFARLGHYTAVTIGGRWEQVRSL